MSATIDDGGPAFPVFNPHTLNCEHPGMSLRDWFAGQALAGSFEQTILVSPKRPTAEEYAESAYRMADAMIAARKGAKL